MVLLAHEYQTSVKDETYCPDMIFEWRRSLIGVLFVHCEVKALETAALAYLHGPPRRNLLKANRRKREKLLEQCMRAERLHAGIPGDRCYLGVLCDLSTGARQVPVCRGQSAGDVRKCAEERVTEGHGGEGDESSALKGMFECQSETSCSGAQHSAIRPRMTSMRTAWPT